VQPEKIMDDGDNRFFKRWHRNNPTQCFRVGAALSSTSAIGLQHQSLHAEAAIDCHDFQLAAKLGADADQNAEPSRLSARIPLPT
jgi:hypothetical protein